MTQPDALPPTPAFTITFEPSGWQCIGDDTRTLMETARSAAIALPSSCRNGTCRTCLCLLQSGAVRYRIEWPGVSVDEKKAGWILPCVAIPCSSVIIVAPRVARIPVSSPSNTHTDTPVPAITFTNFTDE